MDETHNPDTKSFIEVDPDSHFPIQNLPYGVFSTAHKKQPRVGVAIGDMILDLSVIEKEGLFEDIYPKESQFFSRPTLNEFMSRNRDLWKKVRKKIHFLLREDVSVLRDDKSLLKNALVSMEKATMHLPVSIGDYTDFYSSKEHATNLGTMFRGPENALQPNWLHLPVGYHGRASSVMVSGVNFYRPKGQVKLPDQSKPIFRETKALDFELEMGFFVGPGNDLGDPISVNDAYNHIFGLVIVNDWSARDIQKWEYVPLGPFNGKNFITSISPWVVTLEALEPFLVPAPKQDPEPLEYLKQTDRKTYDIHLEVALRTKKNESPETIITSNFKYLYWTMEQQLAHHSVTGCNMRTGDLLASGTISGPNKGEHGCLIELTKAGKNPLTLKNGEQRTYLEDFDSVIMTGWAKNDHYKIGFGEVVGQVLPAKK